MFTCRAVMAMEVAKEVLQEYLSTFQPSIVEKESLLTLEPPIRTFTRSLPRVSERYGKM
jgi:hypothetical protein